MPPGCQGSQLPSPMLHGRQQAAELPFLAAVGGHRLQALLCTGPHAAGIPASPHVSCLFRDVSCLLEAAPATLRSWGSAGSVN